MVALVVAEVLDPILALALALHQVPAQAALQDPLVQVQAPPVQELVVAVPPVKALAALVAELVLERVALAERAQAGQALAAAVVQVGAVAPVAVVVVHPPTKDG